MAKSRRDREMELTDLINAGDWKGVQKLAEDSAAEDRDFAEKTGDIFWAHKDLAG